MEEGTAVPTGNLEASLEGKERASPARFFDELTEVGLGLAVRRVTAMKKVLVVDDSATVRQQVRQALGQAGFDVIEATDGADGVTKVAADRGIGLVILDVNMPRMSGLEMLEKVKETAENAGLNVIMLTSEGHQALIERAKKAGAKGWIVKPFKAELLVAAVRRLLAA
jgi:two-component system, chemotaxis family, chemotaxis protein CheY